MKNVQIGGTNWEVSNVALGIMRMGTLAVTKAIDALEAAHDAGINFIAVSYTHLTLPTKA